MAQRIVDHHDGGSGCLVFKSEAKSINNGLFFVSDKFAQFIVEVVTVMTACGGVLYRLSV